MKSYSNSLLIISVSLRKVNVYERRESEVNMERKATERERERERKRERGGGEEGMYERELVESME